MDFDRFAKDYDQHLHRSTRVWSGDPTWFARRKIQLLRQVYPFHPASILEFGCGTGRNLPFLVELFPGSRIVGCDLSELSLSQARQSSPELEFFLCNGDQDTRERFDLILLSCVLHHVVDEDCSDLVRDLCDRLNPRGTLAVVEHNPLNPFTRKIVRDCAYDKDARLFGAKRLISLLQNGGFEFLRLNYIHFFPPVFRAPLWIEEVLGFVPLGAQYILQMTRAGLES